MNNIEKVAFFDKQLGRAQMGIESAKQTGNCHLAALNCGQALKSRMMQGLITWRSGDNPTPFFEQAVSRFAEDWQTVRKIGGDAAMLSDAGYEQVYFVAYLVNQPPPFTVESNASRNLQCDQMLDATLGQWLFDGWDARLWEAGMEGLQRVGSGLSVETYEFYKELTLATEQDMPQLEARADKLFRRRKRDSFFAGGVQTSGGGPDNDFTVDYRFAALAKHIGYVGNSIHIWSW